ncbi:hypothetical protein A4S06_05420 [Erysipelotrichaceae bacterium MTC7]|nr:hypothetical protein A4S06_05420 [Erysipelotrichaceae bacterium MTC7]
MSIKQVVQLTADDKDIYPVLSDTGWIDLPLQNGAVNQGTWETAQYRKIGMIVYVKGLVTCVPDKVIAILPVGFRPKTRFTIASVGYNASSAQFVKLNVDSSGTIDFTATSGTYARSIKCSFPAEQ